MQGQEWGISPSTAPGQDWASTAWSRCSSGFGVKGNGEKRPLTPTHPLVEAFPYPSPQRQGCCGGGVSGSPGDFSRSKQVQVAPPAPHWCENASPAPEHPRPHPVPSSSLPHPGMGSRAPRGGTGRGLVPGAAGGSKASAVSGGGGTNRRRRPGTKHTEKLLISHSITALRRPGPAGSSGHAPVAAGVVPPMPAVQPWGHPWVRGPARWGRQLRAAAGAQRRAAGWS